MSSKPVPGPGDPAPDFCLPDQDEHSVCLDRFRDQWVVLYFYPKDNTSGCTREACEFTADAAAFRDLDAVILGVSPDSPQSHRKFIARHDLQLTLLSDPEHKVLGLYGAWGKKSMYGKEYEGVIRTTVLIDPAGTVRHIWPKVKVAGHVEAVRTTLASLRGQ